MMGMESKYIWMNGELVEFEKATLHFLTPALHYGVGVFEGIRCYETEKGPAIFRLKEHVYRLFGSAHIFLMEIPFTEKEITEAIIKTVEVNKVRECYIRPLVYIGYGAMGLYPKDNPIRVSIAAWPWGTYLGDEALEKGIRVKVSSFARHHIGSTMTMAKVCGYYVNSQIAKKEAITGGFDEALLLDTEGYVSEGSGENIFIVRNNVIITPPLHS